METEFLRVRLNSNMCFVLFLLLSVADTYFSTGNNLQINFVYQGPSVCFCLRAWKYGVV